MQNGRIIVGQSNRVAKLQSFKVATKRIVGYAILKVFFQNSTRLEHDYVIRELGSVPVGEANGC